MENILDKIFYFCTRWMFFFGKIKTQLFYKLFFGKIGKGSVIVKADLISNPSHIFIGENTIIHSNARILCITHYRSGQNFNPRIKIGTRVNIQQGAHISCVNEINIGDGVSIAPNAVILDNEHGYNDISKPIHNQEILTGSVVIGENSLIGAGVVILKAKIGKNCIVGANAVVKGEFPDYCVIAGVPAKIIKMIKP